MTPKQTKWYWREWAAVRRIQPDADRHEFHRRALDGRDKSSKLLTQFQFDLVLIEFVAVSDPTNLTKIMRLKNQCRNRAMWTIRNAPIAYVQALCTDKFSTRDPEHLTLAQLCQLAMTLNNRRDSIEDHEIRAGEAADPELVGTSSTASHETTHMGTDADPF